MTDNPARAPSHTCESESIGQTPRSRDCRLDGLESADPRTRPASHPFKSLSVSLSGTFVFFPWILRVSR